MFIAIISFIFVFTILAIAHEGGHFILARRAGMRVHEFGLGFGPRLYAIKRGNTVYSLNAIPFLAFVRIAGADTEGGDNEDDTETPENEKFYNKSIKERFLSLVAGPLANLFVAFLVLSLIFSIVGVPKTSSSVIETIKKGSVAERVGLKPGDKIVSINGKTFVNAENLIKLIHNSAGAELILGIQRGNKQFTVNATPEFDKKLNVGLIGFTPKVIYERVDPLLAIYYGGQQVFLLSVMTLYFLGLLFVGGISLTHLAGPVGIAQITGQYADSGLLSLFHFLAFLNINIGILNLLPLPALDGGRIFFLIIEAIRRKPISVTLENRIHQVGLSILLVIMVLVTLNDIWRIITT